jgi:hypothetical protein
MRAPFGDCHEDERDNLMIFLPSAGTEDSARRILEGKKRESIKV